MYKIEEVSNITANEFITDVLPAGKPLVLRGLVNDWPIVKAAKSSNEAFCNYLKRFDRGDELNTVFASASIQGRFFYNQDMSGMNFRSEKKSLASSLDFLLKNSGNDPTPPLAIQSVNISKYLPGMEKENYLNSISENVSPRIWIGNKSVVAAHYDVAENIACCVAGKRLFTLFPSAQIKNLYVGPFEFTPSGVSVSMVDFDKPDYEKFPEFKNAEANSYQAELYPGDAIYIPYLWWHHVRALEPLNALVNYWWTDPAPIFGEPSDAMQHALLALKNLSPAQKNAWKALFDFYVFTESDEPPSYIPQERQGILGKLDADKIQVLKSTLLKSLNRI